MGVHVRVLGESNPADEWRQNGAQMLERDKPRVSEYARSLSVRNEIAPESKLDDDIRDDQRQIAGYDITDPRRFTSEYNPANINGRNSEDPNSEKKKRERMHMLQAAMIAMDIDLSFDNVMNFLDESVEFTRSLLPTSEMFIEIDESRMLHVRDGVSIDPADDPDNLYLVRTTEERLAYENSVSMCTGAFAQEEVTVMDGRLVDVNAFNGHQSLLADIDHLEDTRARIESGELDPADLDPELVERMRDRLAEPEVDQALAAAPPTLNADSLLPPAPRPQMAPAPSFTPDM